MSNPIPDLVKFLRGRGIPVVDKRVPGRDGRFEPCGLMVHHTASAAGSGDVPSLGIVTRGRPDVAGPLAQIVLGRAGTVVVVTDGRANHPGKVHGPTIDRVRNGGRQSDPNCCDGGDTANYGASTYLWGIEAENNGLGEPWPKVQVERYLQICEAFCRELGWDPWAKIIAHKKATRRKIDPSFDMRWFLDEVTRRLGGAPGWGAAVPIRELEDFMPQWSEWKPEERQALLDDIYIRLVPRLTGSEIASVNDPVTNLGTLYNRTSEILGAVELVQARGGQIDLDVLAEKVKAGLGAELAKSLGEKLAS